MEAVLVLEDGKIYKGKLIGKSGAAIGELIFNTSMTGYEEILTDPSYRGQLVILTYPLIGNYGINENELDLSQPHLSGLIIKEHCEKPVHKKAQSSLMSYLNKKDIVGISNIDTRALTKYIRENGNMIGLISSENLNKEEFLALLSEKKREKRNLVKEVSIKKTTRIPGNSFRIVLMDFGVKYNILRSLRKYDIDLIIVPYNTKAEEIYSYDPDGIILAGGPGDPRDNPALVAEIKKLIEYYPVLGISLGHQLLALALGADIYKLKYGHYGGNQPVKDLTTGKISITSQNHSFSICEELPDDIQVTKINLNDGSIEGFKHKKLPLLSLEFYPESVDSTGIFPEYFKLLRKKVLYNVQ